MLFDNRGSKYCLSLTGSTKEEVMRKKVRETGVISLCLVLCAYATLTVAPPAAAGGGALVGGISVKGRVLINGSEVVSEAAFFPGSRFATERGAVAEISLSGLGRVRCLEESAGAVDFREGAFAGRLDAGIIHVSKPRGVTAVVSTRDGSVVAGEEEAVFIVNVTGGNTLVKARLGRVELRAGKTTTVVKQGETGAAGTQQTPTRDDDDDDDTDGLFWLGVTGYLAIVTAAIIYSVTRDDDDGQNAPGPPTVINPSPIR